MRSSSLILGVTLALVGASVQAEPSDWEVRGDAFLQAGNLQRALLAYETALAANPKDKILLDKYQKTFLLVLSEQKVEADAGRRAGPLNRMGSRPAAPSPEPDAVPADGPGAEPGASETAKGAHGTKPARPAADPKAAKGTKATKPAKGGKAPEEPAAEGAPAEGDGTSEAAPAEGSGEADPADTIRVRDDGTIELRFGHLNRMGAAGGLSRMGGTGGDATTEEAPEEEEPPKPAVFGGGQTVAVSQPKLGFEGAGGDSVAPENTVIQTTKYRIEGVTLAYQGRALLVRGQLTNVSGQLIKLPRVYVSIFDEAGVLRGRNFGYLSPGRNLLARGATKKFEVKFAGYTDPVASYRIEVIP